jgi:hypothetical protein
MLPNLNQFPIDRKRKKYESNSMAAALPAVGAAPIVTLPGVFRGRELTRKDRRLSASLEPVNILLEGGIPRGRISEIVGRRGCGKTSLAAAFISSATRRGEVTAVIDLANAFDPASMAEAEVELSRVLWVHPGVATLRNGNRQFSGWSEKGGGWEPEVEELLEVYQNPRPHPLPQLNGEGNSRRARLGAVDRGFLRAAELVLEAGGFGLLVMDFGERAFTLPQSAALRLARMAERSGTAVLMLVTRPVCGTFAALSLDLASMRPIFSRSRVGRTLPRLSERIARPGAETKLSNYLKCIRHPHPYPHPGPLPGQGEGTEPLSGWGTAKGLPRLNVGEGGERALFEGIEIKASIRRNKIGRCGLSAQWCSLVNQSDSTGLAQASKAARLA